MSPLCQEISSGGKTIQVDIHEDGQHGWTLEAMHENGTSTVWDDPLPTDTDTDTDEEPM